MKANLDLVTILQCAPRPEPPEDLLATLEKQIELAPVLRTELPSALWLRWRRLWIPLAGLTGAAAIAVALAMLLSTGTTRSFAETLGLLTKVKSFHVVDRQRDGPPRPEAGPNGTGMTPNHPLNPLVVSEYWYQQDPSKPSHTRIRSTSAKEDVWREGNRVLTLNHETGARSFQLNNAFVEAGGMGWSAWNPQAMAKDARLREVPAAKMPGAGPADANAFWFGEYRAPAENAICRLWVSRTNELPVRYQIWSTRFPQVAPEALVREFEFSDFNADFPDKTSSLEITDQDLAQLGITRAELDALSDKAMSIELTGEAGVEIVGTLKDDAGLRQVRGKLPFTIVHEQHGKLNFDFRTANGFRHSFGVRLKGLPYGGLDQTRTSHIWGWAGTNWQGRLEAD